MSYSAITNSGLILLAFTLFTFESIFAGILYLLVYLFSTFSIFFSFLVTKAKQWNSTELTEFSSLNSLKLINPVLVFFISINFLSMAGIPPLGGFISKFLIFTALVEGNYIRLLLSLIIISLISAFYYIRPVKLLVFTSNKQPKFLHELTFNSSLIIALVFFFNCFFIIQPRLILSSIENILNNSLTQI